MLSARILLLQLQLSRAVALLKLMNQMTKTPTTHGLIAILGNLMMTTTKAMMMKTLFSTLMTTPHLDSQTAWVDAQVDSLVSQRA